MPGGGSGGGFSPSSNSNIQIYQPQNQPGADVNWNQIMSGLLGQYNAGQSPGQLAWPNVQQYSGNIQQNPYMGGPITGGLGAQNYFQNLYQPTAENFANQLFSQGSQAGYLGSQIPGLTFGNTQYQQAQTLGDTLSGMLGNTSLINMALGAGQNPAFGQAQSLGDTLSGILGNPALVNRALGAGQNPAFGQALRYGQQAAPSLMGWAPAAAQSGINVQSALNQLAPQATLGGAQAQANINPIASSIWNTAQDPQSALYQRTAQQLMDQLGAASGAAGTAGSPYAAGLASDALRNFNIDWQNQQLNRQIAGGQAAGGLYGQGINALLSGLGQGGALYGQGQNALNAGLTTGAGLYGTAQNLLTNPALAQLQGMSSAATTAEGLGQAGIQSMLNPALAQLQGMSSAATTAEGLGQAGIQSMLNPANAQTLAAATGVGALGGLNNIFSGNLQTGLGDINNVLGQMQGIYSAPYNAYNQIQGNNLGALQNMINLGNAQYQLPQQLMGNLQSYMQLGQSANATAVQDALTQEQMNNQALMGIGGLGSNLLFGNQGLGLGGSSGLLGGGGGLFSTGGFLGSQGPLFGTAADASIAAGGPPLALDAAPLALGS